MREAKVAWLGRTLGGAARRTAKVMRLPQDLVKRVLTRRDGSTWPGGGDARIVGGRIKYDRGNGTPRVRMDPADASKSLCHPDPAVRVRALRALGMLSKQRAEHLVAPLLHDPHPAVRTAAAETAAEIDASTAVFSLILGLEDGDETVREACHDAIREITGRTPWHGHLDAPGRERMVVELRGWWKEERMSILARKARED